MFPSYKPRQRSLLVKAYAYASLPAFVVLAFVALQLAVVLAVINFGVYLWGRLEG